MAYVLAQGKERAPPCILRRMHDGLLSSLLLDVLVSSTGYEPYRASSTSSPSSYFTCMPRGIRGGKKARARSDAFVRTQADPKKAKVRHADGSSRSLYTRAGWVSSESEAELQAQLFEEAEEEDEEPELEVATAASGGALAASAPAPRSLVWERGASVALCFSAVNCWFEAGDFLYTGQAVRPLATALPRPAGSGSVLNRALREAVQLRGNTGYQEPFRKTSRSREFPNPPISI